VTENLELILSGLTTALRGQDADKIAGLLAADVIWEGPQPGLRCDGRDEAMRIIRHAFSDHRIGADAVEAFAAGQDVVIGLHGPGFNGTPGDRETVGQVYYVVTLRDGKIIRWRAFMTRPEALAAAGIPGPTWQ
jgi:ketosteroid isomerase-like protein